MRIIRSASIIMSLPGDGEVVWEKILEQFSRKRALGGSALMAETTVKERVV